MTALPGDLPRVRLAATVLAAAIACTGCLAQDDADAPTPTGRSSPDAQGAPGEPMHDGELQTLGELGELTAADEEAAVERARAFLTAFADTDQPEAAWWAGLQQHLTEDATLEYAYVDPASVPVTDVGRARLLRQGASASLVEVTVRTDVGAYTLTLTRLAAEDPWLVARADPPQDTP